MKKCGVTFSIWNKPDENGNLTDKYDWTSLMGADKKTLLYNLPDSFAEFVPPDNLETVTKIWKVIILGLIRLGFRLRGTILTTYPQAV